MKLLPYLTLGLFFISCGAEPEEESTSTGEFITENPILDSCDCAELEIDSAAFHSKEGEGYTGICTDYYPNTKDKYVEKNLLDGKLHGNVIYYDRDGNVLMEETYQEGTRKQSGELDYILCDCTELNKVANADPRLPARYYLDDIPFTGKCEQKYPDSDQIYVEAEYKKGVLHGTSKYYDKSGNTLYLEEYLNGVLEQTVYEGS